MSAKRREKRTLVQRCVTERDVRVDAMTFEPGRPQDRTSTSADPGGVAGQQHVVAARPAEVPDRRHSFQVGLAAFRRRIEVLRAAPRTGATTAGSWWSAAHVQGVPDDLEFGRFARTADRLRGLRRSAASSRRPSAEHAGPGRARPKPGSASTRLSGASPVSVSSCGWAVRETRLPEQPRVKLFLEGVDDLGAAGAQPPDRQAQLAFPSLRGPHPAPEVRGNLLPAVEAAGNGAVGRWDV